MTPPAPWIGSAMNAATVSGPSRRMAASRSLAAATPTLTSGSFDTYRYGSGAAMCEKPGTRGSNMGQKAGSPVALIAPSVSP